MRLHDIVVCILIATIGMFIADIIEEKIKNKNTNEKT